MITSADIWMQTLDGRAVDLVFPTGKHVDFREIAEALSGINRFAGHTRPLISVALHTLVAIDAAVDPAVKPYIAVHDAHEAYIGDIITPTAHAIAFIAGQHGRAVREALDTLKYRHDLAIWHAAGLSPPSEAMCAAIKRADIVAQATERRDFMVRPPRPWAAAIEMAEPLKRRIKWLSPPDAADRLFATFQELLPCFARERAFA